MKKYNFKSRDKTVFITLSKKLRLELEEKLDDLWTSGKFKRYTKTDFKLDFLKNECDKIVRCTSDIGKNENARALAVCKSIKTWYGMYYEDRVSVMQQFNLLYAAQLKSESVFLPGNLHLKFVRLFIHEFATILSDYKWAEICQLGYD